MSRSSEVIQGIAVPRGRFPHYHRAGDFIFVSGTSSRRPDNSFAGVTSNTDGSVSLDIIEQTGAVIENIGNILVTAGSCLEDLVDITTFLVDMEDFDAYNEVYGKYFSESGPSRTTVAVKELPHPHLLIEIRATAYCPLEEEIS